MRGGALLYRDKGYGIQGGVVDVAFARLLEMGLCRWLVSYHFDFNRYRILYIGLSVIPGGLCQRLCKVASGLAKKRDTCQDTSGI